MDHLNRTSEYPIVMKAPEMAPKPKNPQDREASPTLANVPAPSGRHANFAAYIRHAIAMAGTARDLGHMLGFTSGTRISDWKLARGGRPSMESCLRLAKLTGDDPIDVLVMAGYHEEAALLLEFGIKREPNEGRNLELLRIKKKLFEAREEAELLLERLNRTLPES